MEFKEVIILFKKIFNKIKLFCKDGKGDLAAAGWVIGALVIVVVIVLAIKAIAPGTAEQLWNTIWQWTMNQIGIS